MPLYNARGNINVTVNDTSMPFGIYAADGSLRVKIVSGAAPVGLYAADGAYNVVVVADTDTAAGVYHPSGALRVVPAELQVGRLSPSGGIYMSGLSFNRSFIADAGSYTVQGTLANFLYSRDLSALSGVYTITGTDATVTAVFFGPPSLGTWDRALEDNWGRITEAGDKRVTEDFTDDVITNLVVTPLTGGKSASIDLDCSATSGIFYGGMYRATATVPTEEQIEAGTDGDDNPFEWDVAFDLSSTTDISAGPEDLTQSTAYKFSCVVRRSAAVGDYSNIATDSFTTLDAAPIISSLSAWYNTHNTGVFNLNTDDPTGTVKWGWFPAASSPTKSNILNGTGGAVAYGSVSVSALGVVSVPSVTGLSASTEYKVHAYQIDGSTNESDILTSSAFFTPPSKTTRFSLVTAGATTGLSLGSVTSATAQTDPLGGSNAVKLTCTPAGSTLSPTITYNGEVGTVSHYSFWIKKGAWASANAYIRWRITNTSPQTPSFNFNLDTGVFSPLSSLITNATAIKMSDGYWFIAFDLNLTGNTDTNGASTISHASASSNASVSTTGAHELYLYDYKNVY